MKEIMAIVRIKRTGATKKALVSAGVAGFTAMKVMGRGKLVKDEEVIMPCKDKLMKMATDDVTDKKESEEEVVTFLDDTRLFPRRLFTILAYDEDVPRIVKAIIEANQTKRGAGDGKIFVTHVTDAVRVRTGESGDAAIW
ncbi:nitrogen regulatory protein PII 2 [Methanomicrobium sp. W14]|uniref:P-II family nitrogen regulator n=1 Tax=Methanomicrobium sp. W14 TaxID=2817839 RepID=UPI001AE8B9F7|nr:P-II family nitrogen regulator [Methanomicrobium sp. W14]MBP2132592.1 nitrogen regulatory protein PII 2 [Methanomicrobium sp. W14]